MLEVRAFFRMFVKHVEADMDDPSSCVVANHDVVSRAVPDRRQWQVDLLVCPQDAILPSRCGKRRSKASFPNFPSRLSSKIIRSPARAMAVIFSAFPPPRGHSCLQASPPKHEVANDLGQKTLAGTSDVRIDEKQRRWTVEGEPCERCEQAPQPRSAMVGVLELEIAHYIEQCLPGARASSIPMLSGIDGNVPDGSKRTPVRWS